MPVVSEVSDVVEGPIRQIGYVVHDLDAAVRSWLALGVGPWFTMRNLEQKDCRYRGEPCEVTLSLAFANSGSMQVEVIQQHDASPSIYREFLDSGREGFHQLAWWVSDFDAMLRRADAAGWPAVYSGEGADVRFAYFELDTMLSTIVEVMEHNDTTRGFAELVAGAAADWDGATDPIRPLL